MLAIFLHSSIDTTFHPSALKFSCQRNYRRLHPHPSVSSCINAAEVQLAIGVQFESGEYVGLIQIFDQTIDGIVTARFVTMRNVGCGFLLFSPLLLLSKASIFEPHTKRGGKMGKILNPVTKTFHFCFFKFLTPFVIVQSSFFPFP